MVFMEGVSAQTAVSQYGEPMWWFLFARPLLDFRPLTSH